MFFVYILLMLFVLAIGIRISGNVVRSKDINCKSTKLRLVTTDKRKNSGIESQFQKFSKETFNNERIFLNQQHYIKPSFSVMEKLDAMKCDLEVGCENPNAMCFHVHETIHLEGGSILEPNLVAKEGYCLMYEKPQAPNLCNPKYGATITSVMPSGLLRTTCRCYWPSLFDQKDIYSDCSVLRACGGNGKLVHSKTRVPLEHIPLDVKINIHEFECGDCGTSNCATPGKNMHTGLPSCVPTPVADRTGGLCLYESLLNDSDYYITDNSDEIEPATTGRHTTAPVLAIKGVFVSGEFAKSFSNSSLDKAYVPNPCAFDAFRGVSIENECRLTLTPSGIGYCEPLTETVSTVIYDDDYLPKNGGRYSNACYRFTNTKGNVDAYIAEYFVRSNNERILTNSSGLRTPPLPVMSVEIEAGKLDSNILDMLNMRSAVNPKTKILITQSAIPEDVESIPVPFDKATMSRFVHEHNDFVYLIPAKYALFKYWAPVQKLEILKCNNINEEREVAGFTFNTIEDSEYEMKRQQHVVACREPNYDRRLSIVPNIDVNELGAAFNADPTSAILRFDKLDFTVRPYWYRSFVNNRLEIKAYLSRLQSRPPMV